MATSDLITMGVGPGGDITTLLTGGLQIGAAAAVWTDTAADDGTWTDTAAASGVWTDTAAASDAWTEQ